ncbi:MAG TPA: response regulator [bacterium]|nr:response regulator [bacterium]
MLYNILIIDDSPSMRKVLQKVIAMAGLPVEYFEASDGIQGLDQCRHHRIDVIFTDLNMPNMDGFTFLKQIHQNPAFDDIPVLVVSTEGRTALIEEALKLGVANFINKPFQAEEIADKLHNILGEGYDHREDRTTEAPDF